MREIDRRAGGGAFRARNIRAATRGRRGFRGGSRGG